MGGRRTGRASREHPSCALPRGRCHRSTGRMVCRTTAIDGLRHEARGDLERLAAIGTMAAPGDQHRRHAVFATMRPGCHDDIALSVHHQHGAKGRRLPEGESIHDLWVGHSDLREIGTIGGVMSDGAGDRAVIIGWQRKPATAPPPNQGRCVFGSTHTSPCKGWKRVATWKPLNSLAFPFPKRPGNAWQLATGFPLVSMG